MHMPPVERECPPASTSGGMMANNVRSRARRRALPLLTGMLALLLFTGSASPQNPSGGARPAGSDTQQGFVVEYYYQVRWGYADEFIRLFRKNHYPGAAKAGRVGPVALSDRCRPPVSCDGGPTLGLPGDDRLSKRSSGVGAGRHPRCHRPAAVPGSGRVSPGGAASVRDSARALGCTDGRSRPHATMIAGSSRHVFRVDRYYGIP